MKKHLSKYEARLKAFHKASPKTKDLCAASQHTDAAIAKNKSISNYKNLTAQSEDVR